MTLTIEEKAVRRVRTIRGAIRYRRGLGDGIVPSYLLKLRGTPRSELYLDLDGRYARKPKRKPKDKEARKVPSGTRPRKITTGHPKETKEAMHSHLRSLQEIKAIRHVRTPQGAKRFKQPIGTVIFEKPSLDLFKKMSTEERMKSVQEDLANIAKAYQNGDIDEKRMNELSGEVFTNLGITAPKGKISQRDIDRMKLAVANYGKEPTPKAAPKTRTTKPRATKPKEEPAATAEEFERMTDAERNEYMKVRERIAEQRANNRFGKVERNKTNRGTVAEQSAEKRKRTEEYARQMARTPEQVEAERAEAREKRNASRRAERAGARAERNAEKTPDINEFDVLKPRPVDGGGYSLSTPNGERIVRDGKITLSDGTDVTSDFDPQGTSDYELAQAVREKFKTRTRSRTHHRNITDANRPEGVSLYKGYTADRTRYEDISARVQAAFRPTASERITAQANAARIDQLFSEDRMAGMVELGRVIDTGKLPNESAKKYGSLVPQAVSAYLRAERANKVAEKNTYKAPNKDVTAETSKFADVPVSAMSHMDIRAYLDEAKHNPELQRQRTAEIRNSLEELGISASTNKSLMEKVTRLAKKHGVTGDVALGRKKGSKDTVERSFTERYRSVQRIQKFSSKASERTVLKELLGYDPKRGEFYADIKVDGKRDVLIRRKVSDDLYQGFDANGNAVTLADSDPAVVLSGMAEVAGLRVSAMESTKGVSKATPDEINELREEFGSILPKNASMVWKRDGVTVNQIMDAIREGNKRPEERSKTEVDVNDTVFSFLDQDGNIKHVKPRNIGNTIDWDKWDRYAKVNGAMGKIKRKVSADLKTYEGTGTRDHQIAIVASLMQEHGIRIGSSERKVGDAESFGASQLQKRHVYVGDDGIVHLKFVGKSGKPADYTIGSPLRNRLANALLVLKDSRKNDDDSLFPNANADNVKAYLSKISGLAGIKNHDMRTAYANNVLATLIARQQKEGMTRAEFTKIYNEAAKRVADALNDTVSVAKGSYISPFIFDLLAPKE